MAGYLANMTTRPQSLSPFLAALRVLDYRTFSRYRNSMVYGRDALPFNVTDVRRYSPNYAFTRRLDFGANPFVADTAGEIVNAAWLLLSINERLLAEFGGVESTLADYWLDYLYDGDDQGGFFNFYCGNAFPILGELAAYPG